MNNNAASSVDKFSNALTVNGEVFDSLPMAPDNPVRVEIVFIESNVPGIDVLREGIGVGKEVYVLDASQDGLQQIAALLAGRTGIGALHLISHGSEASVNLGALLLNQSSLADHQSTLQSIGQSLSKDADILLYGCNVGAGTGQDFLDRLAILTSADLAASNNLSGNASMGGDWTLEISTGPLDAVPLSFDAYAFTLPDLTTELVAHYQFESDGTDAAGSDNNATAANVTYAAGKIGNAAVFNGTDAAFTIADLTGFPTSGSYTISSWFSVTGTLRGVITGWGNTSNNAINVLRTTGTNDLTEVPKPGLVNYWWGNDLIVGTPTIPLLNTGWHQVVARYDSGSTKRDIWLDGVKQGELTAGGINAALTNGVIGKAPNGGEFFAGAIDDLRVYNRALADADIVALYPAAPTVAGVPADVTVVEDVASNFDLSAVTVADVNGDNLTVTLSATAGTFAAGSSGSVTVGGSGTVTLTLSGSAANINTWLDTVSNIQYTGASNANGDDAATFTLKANDGTADSNIGSGNIDITAVNDAPALDNTKSPTMGTVLANLAAPSNGSTASSVLVSDLINTTPLTNFSDIDSNPAGIAITGVSSNGKLWFSINNGATWTEPTGTVSATSALTLHADARVYFQPNNGYSGSLSDAITFKAWDRTGGYTNGQSGVVTTGLTLTGTYDTSGEAVGVTVSGNYAYVADRYDPTKYLFFNISNPASPSLAGFYNPGSGYGYAIAINGNSAYLANAMAGLEILNISSLNAPSSVGTYNASVAAVSNVVVRGNYAYVTDWTNGLKVINISTPATPTWAGTYDTSGTAFGLAVSGDYAYVGDGGTGLHVINISNPTSPAWAATYLHPGSDNTYGVAVRGNYAYLGAGASGLVILNISTPASPTLVGTYDTSVSARDVVVAGNFAYVADTTGGLAVIDISTPASPTLAGTLALSNYAFDVDVDVSGNFAYVADGSAGLRVINVSNLLPSSAFSSASDTVAVTVSTAPTVTLSVNNATVAEAAGTSTVTATLSAVAASDTTVTIGSKSTSTAALTDDFTLSSTTITITAGDTTGAATLTAVGDTLDEEDETAIVEITAVSGGNGATENGTQEATVTITDDDTAPTISVANVSLAEGSSGSANMTFTATLSAASGKAITVNYATSDNASATAGGDYTAASGTLNFAAGETTKTFDVPILGDATVEDNETFTVTLSSPSNTTLGTETATGTITNDEGVPTVTLSVDNATVVEAGGTRTVTATLSAVAATDTTVTIGRKVH
ncbi:MAG: DUF4347 domain-containing protein [Rhodoferax sp.]|nr:DUF4347 domain-containing protein [Rhodoferax sp.]